MRTVKVIISIITIVLFFIMGAQACATGCVNAVNLDSEDLGGFAVFGVSLIYLVCGIAGLATKNSKGGGITVGIFFLIAALIGFTSKKSFDDLLVWSILALIFGSVFVLGSIFMKKEKPKEIKIVNE